MRWDLEEGFVEEAGEVPADGGGRRGLHLVDDDVSVLVHESVHRLAQQIPAVDEVLDFEPGLAQVEVGIYRLDLEELDAVLGDLVAVDGGHRLDVVEGGPEVTLGAHREEQHVAGHLVLALDLDAGDGEVQLDLPVRNIGPDVVDAVVAGAQGGHVVEGGTHSDGAVAVLHVQLVDVQGLHRWDVDLRDSLNKIGPQMVEKPLDAVIELRVSSAARKNVFSRVVSALAS